jgi:hypothetical protein
MWVPREDLPPGFHASTRNRRRAGRDRRRARRSRPRTGHHAQQHADRHRRVVGYVVLAVSFVLEGLSFSRSVRQARPTAELMERDLIGAVMATSDPTLRAVFAEDSAALIGLVTVLMFAAVVTVVGYETVGHRHLAAALEQIR